MSKYEGLGKVIEESVRRLCEGKGIAIASPVAWIQVKAAMSISEGVQASVNGEKCGHPI